MNALKLLKQDHEQVAALFETFEEASEENKRALAGQICQLLTVHAQIEEELLYPAARGVLDSECDELVNEATVEHASIKALVSQIETSDSADELFEAKVIVLGEYVNHHVEEEEDELFPRLEETEIDLEALGKALATRKTELMTELGISAEDAVESSDAEADGNVADDLSEKAPATARPKARTKPSAESSR